jgi:cobyrinic acid a,c-diamide synthase
MQGVVIAGTHSGCGKTTITLGILAALTKRGMKVQSFKAGPDFIDSGLHKVITGRPSRNLDLWMCGETYVADCFLVNSAGCDVAIVEGVMGLFDGNLSTASLASSLGVPVVLVIDAYGMAETAGALVRGFKECMAESGLSLAGVIFNRVASPNHYRRLSSAMRGTAVWGFLPRDLRFEIPHRHLGLTIAEEDPVTRENIDALATACEKCIDLDAFRVTGSGKDEGDMRFSGPSGLTGGPLIAVAYDRAFNFYYEDNLDLLKKGGAQIVYFSPLQDEAIPEKAGAVYIGGGYPELHAEALSRNITMRESVRRWAASGRPLYAECGGLMYLSRGIYDFEGGFFEMAGVFPFATAMKRQRSRLGYRQVTLKEDCIIGRRGDELRGHEFHYSEIAEEAGAGPTGPGLYGVRDGSGELVSGDEGYTFKKTIASYIHIHFGSNGHIAQELLRHAQGG